jgi:hypothetical protein
MAKIPSWTIGNSALPKSGDGGRNRNGPSLVVDQSFGVGRSSWEDTFAIAAFTLEFIGRGRKLVPSGPHGHDAELQVHRDLPAVVETIKDGLYVCKAQPADGRHGGGAFGGGCRCCCPPPPTSFSPIVGLEIV